ncbi:HNH endonuclease [Chryseobacterium scophthalmum]|uniref:HNH endonuclease n=1 Tax=Chryseobacterium scophthalmum TaxID=59733 RepID=A0A1N6EB51_9FLAO|nr:HNH endonuclease [Chryseobacterium scophthalmum]SIN80258.1 HNH endonuclease [Chryseobacterium scophthalmum]
MACSRGKANPDNFTKVKLFANSGGYCQRPECNEPLFKTFKEKEIHIAEIAHIISVNKGARKDDSLTDIEKGDYDNLILLCPNCHTIIDKNEDDFPKQLINTWKRNHEESISKIFGIKKFDDRTSVKLIITPLFEENKTVFELYGPETEERFNPESEMPEIWLEKIRTILIPNNRKLLNIIEINSHLLTESEKEIFQNFQQHVKDFEAKHIFNTISTGIRFPQEIKTVYV